MAARRPRRNSASENSYNQYLKSVYSYTSEAYALPETVHTPPPRHLKNEPKKVERRVVKRTVRKRKAEAKPEYIYSTEKEKRMSFMSFVLIVAFFCGVIAMLFSVAAISMKNYELNKVNAALKETKEIREALIADVSQSVDMKEMESKAIALGMKKPLDYQIVEITVPNQRYFVQYEEKVRKEPLTDGLMSIIDFFVGKWSNNKD